MRFDRAFVTNSICAPSRAVILSGLFSHLNGVLTNGETFDPESTTFAGLLTDAGYSTAMIGKWHLRENPRGFDHYEVLIDQGPYYNPPMIRDGERVEHEGYTTDIVTDLAIEWLREGRDPGEPFLLMCQHKAPHRNWQPGPEHIHDFDGMTLPEPATLFDDWADNASPARNQEMTIANHLSEHDLKLAPQARFTDEQQAAWDAAYDPKNAEFLAAGLTGDDLVRWKYQRYAKDYLRCVQSVDDSVGRILDELEAQGLADSTIVVYTSDQGWYLGEHGWYDKRWAYEESMRTPLLVRWPGRVAPGSVSTDLVQNLDFAPTFLDAAGAAIRGVQRWPAGVAAGDPRGDAGGEPGRGPAWGHPRGLAAERVLPLLRASGRAQCGPARGGAHAHAQADQLLRDGRVGAVRPGRRPRRADQYLRPAGDRGDHRAPQGRAAVPAGQVRGDGLGIAPVPCLEPGG